MIYPVSDEERLLFWIRVGCSYHFFRDVLVRSNQVWCQEGFCNPAVGKKPIEWQDGSGINPAGGRQLLTTDHAFTAAQPPRGGGRSISSCLEVWQNWTMSWVQLRIFQGVCVMIFIIFTWLCHDLWATDFDPVGTEGWTSIFFASGKL